MLNKFNYTVFMAKNLFKTKELYEFKIVLTELFLTFATKLVKSYDLLESFVQSRKK